ncbi:MAG: ACP S-malonyltransferase [Puniceicoccales bacterium]|jgi:[acyl-carrier-protein] S-malonyltransferase|nr:ACP S-malonyltransferase [Puniceicoccales bacterium]
MTRVGVIFPGQGAQFVGMGKSMYENDIIAKEYFKRANSILGYDLTDICFQGPIELLTESRFCQPALFIHEYISCIMLTVNGIIGFPDLVFGLSLGEFTALALAEVYSFEIGLRLAANRGLFMQEACEETEGKMVAMIGCSKEEVDKLCKMADVDIANFNAPDQIVISGEAKKIDRAMEIAKKMNLTRMIELTVAGAFHSKLMLSAKVKFEKFISDIRFNRPQIDVISNVTGKFIHDPDEIKSTLCEQITSPVLWVDCMRTALASGISEFYQCGPGKTLVNLAKRIDKKVVIKPIGEFSDLILKV